MFLNLFITVVLLFASQSADVPVQRNFDTQAELPIEFKIDTPTKLSTSLNSVNFVPLEIKKAVKVLSASSDIESLFDRYSNEYSVDKNLLKKIANCESHFNQGSVNGDYGGMFQFASQTWVSTRNQMGLDSNTDLRFNGEEAIKTAAFKISRGGVNAWANCK